MTFRKKSGETVEIDSDEPMSIDELKVLLGETDDAGAACRALALRCDALEKRPLAQPPVKLDWKRATLTITEWDGHGRIKTMNLEKLF